LSKRKKKKIPPRKMVGKTDDKEISPLYQAFWKPEKKKWSKTKKEKQDKKKKVEGRIVGILLEGGRMTRGTQGGIQATIGVTRERNH